MRIVTPARLLAVLGATAALCVLTLAAAPLLGGTPLSLARALDGSLPLADNPDRQILLVARLPRVAAGALTGAGLAVAGAALQALLRNPLAEPFTLGVSSGAALGAAVAIRTGLELWVPAGFAVPIAALLGAALAAVVVYRIARVGGAPAPATLLLAGVTMSFIAGAGILLLQQTAPLATSLRISRWVVGSLDGVRGAALVASLALGAPGLALLLSRARDLNALASGAEVAAGVGVDVPAAVRATYLGAALVIGALVALAGPIGFAGLIVPHVVRAVVGPDHRLVLPACLFCGAAFVVGCDVLARVALAPADLPVGIVTALGGGPFFLWLLRRAGRGWWG